MNSFVDNVPLENISPGSIAMMEYFGLFSIGLTFNIFEW